jgi:DNA gyrase/topoisomerase IV subunit B
VCIRDFGRGIPYGLNKDGISALTLALTALHAGGKHRKEDESQRTYTYSSGVHGVGASVVQAASDYFKAVVYRDNEKAEQTFENGKPITEVIVSTNTENEPTGTYIEFIPSVKRSEYDKKNVFEFGCKFEKEWLVEKLKYVPFLNNGLSVVLDYDGEIIRFEEQTEISNVLKIRNSELHFVNENHKLKEFEYSLLVFENGRKKVIPISQKKDESGFIDSYNSRMRLAFNFVMSNKDTVQLFFVNGVKVKGGKQETALKTQLKKIVNDYLVENKQKFGAVDTEDIMNNMSFVYSVQLNDPLFSGQTKESLNNPEIQTIATTFTKDLFTEWIYGLKNEEKNIFLKILEANKKARNTMQKTQEDAFKEVMAEGESEVMKAQGKLKHCSSKDASKTELFIVEGDSAGGSLEQSRSVKYQALLPLRGKPLNTLKESNKHKILKNQEVASLINALGVGLGEGYNYEKLKYNKIVILADADVDGQHIQALLLAFFYTFYKDLIEKGHVYVAVPPLYKIKRGSNVEYAWNIQELESKLGEKRGEVTRFKGLGEMSPNELFDTTLNPEVRKFVQVAVEDFDNVREELEMFMGEDKNAKIELKSIIKQYYQDHFTEKSILRLSSPEVNKGAM